MAQHRPVISLDPSRVEGSWKESLVYGIHWIDDSFGAHEWGTRHVAVGSVIAIGVIKLLTGEWKGVRWYSLSHAVVTGYLSLVCVVLNIFAAEHLTGTTEPLRSVLCQGPMTSLHRVVPAITMGFGFFDIIEGLNHGPDFILHGVATLSVMAYFTEFDVGEIIVPMLLMEISTPFLSLTRFELFNDTAMTVNMGLFVLSFFFYRCLVVPYIMLEIFITVLKERNNPMSQECLPWHFAHVVFIFGLFFNCLNYYWAYKIVLKVRRKLSGKEKVGDKNDLKDSHKME